HVHGDPDAIAPAVLASALPARRAFQIFFVLLSRVPAREWVETASRAHALPEPLPLFRGHVLPPLAHPVHHSIRPPLSDAAAEAGWIPRGGSKSAKQDPAQRQESNALPEGNLAPPENRRQQPVPQQFDQFTADRDEQEQSDDRQRPDPDQSPSHVELLT